MSADLFEKLPSVPRFNIQNLILFYNLLKCVKGSVGMLMEC